MLFFLYQFFSRSRACSHLFAVLLLLTDLNDPEVDTLLVRCWAVVTVLLIVSQRVRKSAMPKPDKMLRFRPLKELETAVLKLKRVVLFHPEPLVKKLAGEYCVCRKDERPDETGMVQCETCWEWFHFDCLSIREGTDYTGVDWTCVWCKNMPDKQGYQRWKKGARKRHVRDFPKLHGAEYGENQPQRYSAPPTWEGKVAEVKELARRQAIRKRKLTETVEGLVDQGGHHLVDAQGMAGLVLRPVDAGLVDEMIGEGLVDPAQIDDKD